MNIKDTIVMTTCLTSSNAIQSSKKELLKEIQERLEDFLFTYEVNQERALTDIRNMSIALEEILDEKDIKDFKRATQKFIGRHVNVDDKKSKEILEREVT